MCLEHRTLNQHQQYFKLKDVSLISFFNMMQLVIVLLDLGLTV